MLAVSNDDGNDGTVQASALKAVKEGEYSNVLGRRGKGESAWQVGDDAWLCGSGASTLAAFAVIDVENAAGYAYLFREAKKNPDMADFLNSPDTTILSLIHI